MFCTTPSWVTLAEDNDSIVGDADKNKAVRNPLNTVFDAKHIIGRIKNDQNLSQEIEHWPYNVDFSENKPVIVLNDNNVTKKMAPEEVSAKI